MTGEKRESLPSTLRHSADWIERQGGFAFTANDLREAADEIERLEVARTANVALIEENERLRLNLEGAKSYVRDATRDIERLQKEVTKEHAIASMVERTAKEYRAEIEKLRAIIRYAVGHLEDDSGYGDSVGEATDSLKAALLDEKMS